MNVFQTPIEIIGDDDMWWWWSWWCDLVVSSDNELHNDDGW